MEETEDYASDPADGPVSFSTQRVSLNPQIQKAMKKLGNFNEDKFSLGAWR